MKFRYLYTRLNVEHFQPCKAFYRDVLGLTVVFEDEQDEYVEFDTGSTRITLFNRQKLTDFIPTQEPLSYDPHSASIALTFEVENLETAIAHLKAQGVEMLNIPTSYPDRGFMSACFRDPEGNLIELEQMTDVLIT